MDEIRLPTQFNSDGFELSLIEREGDFAIYSQSKHGRVIAYEAVKIAHSPAKIAPDGRLMNPRESYPSPRDWGRNAFSCNTITRARERVDQMRQRSSKSILRGNEGTDTLEA